MLSHGLIISLLTMDEVGAREMCSGDDEDVPQFEGSSGSDERSVDQVASNGEGSDGVEEDEEDVVEGDANSGWAEAMAKILGKKMGKTRSSILIKNKELDKMKEKERHEQLERKKQADKKHVWEMMSREKPDVVKDREAERALQRIATRGVVQLFNAVRKHQKSMDDKLKEGGGSERKKAKILTSVSKKDFIDILHGEKDGGRRPSGKAEKHKAAGEETPAWSVLRDDYMMGATMKDWDKESEQEA